MNKCGRSDVNLRVVTAARLSAVSATRLHEFDLMFGMRTALTTDHIAKFFDKVHGVAKLRLDAVMIKNRQQAAEEARQALDYKGDTTLNLINGETAIYLA